MRTTQNTMLITGGSAGIGYEMAKQFSQKGNKVIILGRNDDRLKKAAAEIENVTYMVCDVSNAKSVAQMAERVGHDFPELNIVINNAGTAVPYQLSIGAGAYEKAADEICTNYLSIVDLNEKLLPIISKNQNAAIVHVTSVVAITPAVNIPTYSASKAALRSYTFSLRHALQADNIKVFELLPPLVNTALSKEIGGVNGIAPSVAAAELLNGMEQDVFEIQVGITKDIYKLFLSSPEQAFNVLNAAR